mgnify:CR=1 FL=1
MIRLLLAALAVFSFASTSTAGVLDCPPTFPGMPSIATCPVGQSHNGPCLAHARLTYKTSWNAEVKPLGWQRCNSLDVIDDLIEEIIVLDALVASYQVTLADLEQDCADGDPIACSQATLVARIIVLKQEEIAGLGAQITGRYAQIDIWVTAAYAKQNQLKAELVTEAASCCEGFALMATIPGFSVDDCDAASLYRTPAVPFCAGTMNQQCLDDARTAHYNGWINGVGVIAEFNCREYKRWQILMAKIADMQIECDDRPDSPICSILAYAKIDAAILAGQIDSRDLTVQIQQGLLMGVFIDAANACCGN